VASPAYLRSEWCGAERNAFMQVLAKRHDCSRAVFLIGIEPIEQAKLPADLRDYRGYEFYRALEDGRTTRPLRTELVSDIETYNNRLSQLVQNIADHLETLAGEPPVRCEREPEGPAPVPEEPRPSVLLLDTTDDLVQRRAELKNYLEQLGVAVLPDKRYSRDDMALHRQQLLADLARSRTCIQVLGPLSGDRSDHARGMAWLRYECVRDSGMEIPLVQWRDPDLNLDVVTDVDARELLTRASVRTDRFPDFRRAVGELALKSPRPARKAAPNTMSVFVHSDVLDRPLGVGVAQWLESQGFMVLEPPQSTIDAREEWETNLRYCDSLLLMYGRSKPSWVKTQILLSNKVSREAPLKLLGVCVGPPRPDHDKTVDLALRYAGIHYVRNEDSPQPNSEELQRFANKLLDTYAA
jgi:hypothetical protein